MVNDVDIFGEILVGLQRLKVMRLSLVVFVCGENEKNVVCM